MIVPFLKLIRFKNLLIIAAAQLLLKYSFLNGSGISLSLSNTYFLMLLIATISIAAAGYIINDVYDVDIDKINKPKSVIINKFITEKSAISFFVFFNALGLVLSSFLAYKIGHLAYGLIYLFMAFSLLQYAQSWKNLLFVKNILVSFLVALSVLLVGIYDIIPTTTPLNAHSQSIVFSIVIDYTLFAFLMNLIREIVKDAEDVDGDQKKDVKSIILVYGIKKTKLLLYFLNVLLIIAVIYYTLTFFSFSNISLIYMFLLVAFPSIVNFVWLIKAKEKRDFKKISKLLKLIMLFGLGSIALINLLNNYAQ